MGTWQAIDFTNNDDIQSVYSPIKFTFRISGSPSNGQTGTVKDYVSMNVHITPYNMITNQWLNGSSGTNPLPNETFSYRVPYTPYVHNWAANSTPNDGTYRYFSTDISSLLRGYLSYDLRPCSHDTEVEAISRDITMSQVCPNLLSYYQVRFDAEYINVNGNLTRENANSYYYPTVANIALTHEEEINGYFATEHIEQTAATQGINGQLQGDTLQNMYYHHPDNAKNYNRQNYLSVKPKARNIGIDECEYVTFLNQRTSANYLTEVHIHFYKADGTSITNGSGGNYGAIIDASVAGDGTYSGDGNTYHLLDYGNGGFESRHACQVGVGTRNIKEMGIEHPEIFNDEEPLTDWSNVAYYTVDTIYGASTARKMGKTLTYYVDHSRKTYGDTVRFHWQSRLGGIDSYTFDGSATRGIETSSSTFEQSIYPHFNAQLSPTDTSNSMWGGTPTIIMTDTTNTGAVINRVAGLTDDKYPAIRKHQVDAYGNGTAVSRPIPLSDREMMEDLMSSPNVWVERGWEAREGFKEDFSSYSSVSDISDNWHDGSTGDITTDATLPTNEGHITGTSCYKKGNGGGNDQAWLSSKKLFRYDPNKIYEVEIRLKDTSGSGLYYCGLTGYAASSNGVYTGAKLSTGGTNTYGSAHYCTLLGENPANIDKWRTYRGYMSGHMRANTTNTDGFGRRTNPMNPHRAYTGVEYFAPMFLLQWEEEAGVACVDYIKVIEYSPAEKTHERFYSALNRHYYVPVLVKDGGQTLYDSEGVSTVTIDYVESRKKRGIRN